MKCRMMLDRFLFYLVDFPLCAVTFGCVMSKASVRQHISDDVVIDVAVEGEVLDFIDHRGMKNWILLHESRQDCFDVVAMYET